MKRKKKLDYQSGEALLREVMNRSGDSEEKVRKGMDEFWDEVSQSSDPLARKFWLSVRREGERPTAEELFLHLHLLKGCYASVVFTKAGYSYRQATRNYSERKLQELAEQYGGTDKLVQEAMELVMELREKEQPGKTQKEAAAK